VVQQARALRIKNQYETEDHFQHTRQLKLIHQLITQLIEGFHSDAPDLFSRQMNLRSELVVVPLPLPKCLALVTKKEGDITSAAMFDSLASAAISEVEQAQGLLWEGKATPTAQGGVTSQKRLSP